MRSFLNFLEPITTEWETNFTYDRSDGSEWVLTIKYDDNTKKTFKGNAEPYPNGEEVERRIRVLADFGIEPIIF